MKKSNLFISVTLSVSALMTNCQSSETRKNPGNEDLTPSGPYFGYQGDSAPSIMLDEFISSPAKELNGTFSPDGNEFYYTLEYPQARLSMILSTRLQSDNSWSTPEIASFSGKYRDVDVLFSPDGEKIYFTSDRPTDTTSNVARDANIWYVERSDRGWSEPYSVGLPINRESNQFYSSVSNQGTIFYWDYNEQTKSMDIFKATKDGNSYTVEALGEPINTEFFEQDPFISPDGDYLIFRSNKPGGLGASDFYISYSQNGTWTTPQNLGTPINSEAVDYCPFVTSDQQLFIFASNRMKEDWSDQNRKDIKSIQEKMNSTDNGDDNLYWMRADFINELKTTANIEQAPQLVKKQK